jgi:hypothetical protein
MNALQPKRRWLRYSLRTLLVLVTIASAGFGWLGLKVRAKHWEREAVKAIEKLGGAVAYDYECDHDGNWMEHSTPTGPVWLRMILGDAFFANVDTATFGPQTTDEDLRCLAALDQLKRLYLRRTQVTDAGLVHLRGLTHLKEVWVFGTQVTGTGTDELKKSSSKCGY